MAKKTYLPEQIINKLREAEILLNQKATIDVIYCTGESLGKWLYRIVQWEVEIRAVESEGVCHFN